MSQPFLAEIRMFGFTFPPRGNAFCNGQLLSIAQNTALFSLLGTTYGGNGTSNFGLPNLQGRSPVHPGQGPGLSPRDLGEEGGSETVALITTEMPAHTHPMLAEAAAVGGETSPAAHTWGRTAARTPGKLYSDAGPNASMSPLSLLPAGSGLPHNNLSPYLAINFVIAMQGIFPSRN